MSILFLQALCHFFSENHTCLAVDSKKLIAIGYKNGMVVVYPYYSSFKYHPLFEWFIMPWVAYMPQAFSSQHLCVALFHHFIYEHQALKYCMHAGIHNVTLF